MNRDSLIQQTEGSIAYRRTVAELAMLSSPRESMVLSLLAVSRLEQTADPNTSFDRQTLATLLKSLGRDMPLRKDREINAVVERLADATDDSKVISLLEHESLLSPSAVNALRIAIEKNQTHDFLRAWLARPTSRVVKEDHSQTHVSKLMRFLLTSGVVLTLFSFICLFVFPEHQKMYNEFVIELPWTMSATLKLADFMVYFWFLFPLLFFIVAIPFLRWGQFGGYWSRWSPASWMRKVVGSRAQKMQTAIWSRRHGVAQSSQSKAVTKSQTAVLNSVSDSTLQSWLLENMLDNGQFRNERTTTLLATILFGVGHIAIGVLIIMTALGVFQGLLAIINGLNGGSA